MCCDICVVLQVSVPTRNYLVFLIFSTRDKNGHHGIWVPTQMKLFSVSDFFTRDKNRSSIWVPTHEIIQCF